MIILNNSLIIKTTNYYCNNTLNKNYSCTNTQYNNTLIVIITTRGLYESNTTILSITKTMRIIVVVLIILTITINVKSNRFKQFNHNEYEA